MFKAMTKGTQMSGVEGTFLSTSTEDTRWLGESLVAQLVPGDVVALYGDLGAGKSVFTRGLVEGVGDANWQGSPTFALVHEYDTRPPLYHLDLYRLTQDEAMGLGIEEYARDDSLLVVEWAERAPAVLAALAGGRLVTVHIESLGGSSRRIVVHAPLPAAVPRSARA